MVEKEINNTDGYDLDEIITDIIISYELYNSKDIIDSRVYHSSIVTCIRGLGNVEEKPIAKHFKDFYFYGIQNDIDPEAVWRHLMNLVKRGIITYDEKPPKEGYNNIDRRLRHFEIIDKDYAIKRYNYICNNRNKLREKHA